VRRHRHDDPETRHFTVEGGFAEALKLLTALPESGPGLDRERQTLISALGKEIDPLIAEQRLTFNAVPLAFELSCELLEFHFFRVGL